MHEQLDFWSGAAKVTVPVTRTRAAPVGDSAFRPMTREWLKALAAGGGVPVGLGTLYLGGAEGLWWLLCAGCILLLGVVSSAEAERKARAGLVKDADGNATRYTLSLGEESITLDPGRAWIQADAYKWVTRGLLEEPQSYHVLPDGTVEINGEKLSPGDPTGLARLEHEINKRHAAAAFVGAPTKAAGRRQTGPARDPNKVVFRVKIDHLSHLVIECLHGEDRMETGLRGLMNLVENGLMRRPRDLHIDPLQGWIEIEGHRFGCNEEDAARFAELLNREFAPKLKPAGEGTIEIKENPASATGFDIHFVSFHGGLRTEVKGHLTQERLNQLQDDQHCDLLQHGILLRLSPPNLLVRRRRPDGGEERIPEIPDVQYRRTKAAELQRMFNDPRLRRSGVAGVDSNQPASPPLQSPEPEVDASDPHAGSAPSTARPLPVPPPAPASLGAEPAVDSSATTASAAPEPSTPVTVTPSASPLVRPLASSSASPSSPPRAAPATVPSPAPVEPVPSENAASGLFPQADPVHIIGGVFSELARHVDLPIQEVYLSLPRVFHDRRFVVINFGGFEVRDLSELRSDLFYGFYLSFLDAQNPILVYACQGRHLEYGPRKCVVQVSLAGDPEEFKGNALLGLAQDADGNFVFVVTPAYREWIRPKERDYRPVCARFLTPEEYLDHADGCTLIWPEPAVG